MLVNAHDWWTVGLVTLFVATLSEVFLACLVGLLVVMDSRLAGMFAAGCRLAQKV